MKLSFKTKSLVAALGFTAALLSGTAGAVQKVDESVPAYQKASGISGNLSSVGSDTLANLMTMWAEEFNREYPNVNIQIQAAGSSTAPLLASSPPALPCQLHQFAPSSVSVFPKLASGPTHAAFCGDQSVR